jgi:hypothetical protein
MSKTLALCLFAVLGSVACTHQVRPNPNPLSTQSSPLALRARYYIAPEQKALIDSDSYFALGWAHTWNIQIGQALVTSFPQMLGTVFQSVQEASSPEDIGDADVLIIPEIQHFDVHAGGFVSELSISVRGKGSDGTVRLSEAFAGTPTKGKGGSAWMGGAMAGESALQRSAELAFEDVMPKIAQKLRDVFTGTSPKAGVSLR